MSPRKRAVNLATLLTQTARRLPRHDALVHGSTRWSWRQLDDAVSALARALRERGIRQGDCVLLHSANHAEFVQTMFATWRIGAVLAPTNSRLTPSDVTAVAQVCRPALIVCHGAQPDHARAVDTLCENTLWIDATGPDAIAEIAPLGAESGGMPDAEVAPGDAAWYFFTSGTSGSPKAAILTHDQMGFVVNNHLADLMPGTTEEDSSLVLAPLSHGAGVHLLPQIARGARSVLTASRGLDGDEVWSLVERERVSNMFTVPTILKKIAEHPAARTSDRSSLRYVIYAGAPMYAADQDNTRAVLGDVLVQYYGLGEVTGNVTVLPAREHGRPRPDGVEFGTCGRARTGMQIAIRDADGRELPAGESGEICVAGSAVCAGYLNNARANVAAFRDGWFHTGDLGLLDEHGYLYITGRASDMYISGGSNVHPRDIEEKLADHPAVAEVAVLGMPHPVWGEVGVAVWVADPGHDGEPAGSEDLLAWLEPRLSRYKLPRHFVRWPELPKSGYGKIVKRTIRDELLTAGWSDGEPGGAR
ncbi:MULTISPECIES: AMP-binding protein [unclassified Streptomyces]|uniref:AMP-binding protein n=1 Tax=unclassified Streptomyces TaxID=2593676 RepID=UPI002DD7AB04|nr:AMP-binding protein [Streptomyces sp. NBC_01775]WSB75034.1 AMP-binding protein [Streptomyces sp. NBC_01775]WSS45504.1 AMP-binding protein [Streptomyces sp. NBC_01187]